MTVTDPRTSIIDERMKDVHKIIAVSSGKGGVGKSLIASTLALSLANKGFSVGLFDLDFTSPSTHIILGVKDVSPKEDKGIVPAEVHGIRYMSIVYYSQDRAVPLRGFDVSNALIELLSITRWGKLDYLILDMPPGIGDVTLDLIRLIKNTEFLIVTTSSQLAFETVKKLVSLLEMTKTPVIGVVENMKMDDSEEIRRETEKLKLKFLTGIHYDDHVELAIGDVQRLLETRFAKNVQKLAPEI
jgi:ATP-binding protein involved in chromosome partitioning